MSEALPQEIILDTEKQSRGVFVTPELSNAFPEIQGAFVEADAAFIKDAQVYLQRLQNSLFTFKSFGGPEIPASLLYSPSSKNDEMLVIFAPFSDGAPKTSASDLFDYIITTIDKRPSLIDKQKALPGSWNQTTKSAVIYELLKAAENDMPVLTIYSPIPISAYNRGEKKDIRNGDFGPAGRLIASAINEVQQRLHGSSSETQIDKINLHGASLGANNALGAANYLSNKEKVSVPSVTVQELIVGPATVFEVFKKFTMAGRVGSPSQIDPREFISMPKIREPEIRRSIDGFGSELSMYGRMPKATWGQVPNFKKPAYIEGLTHPPQTINAIENLLDKNVSLLIALAENSSLTHKTRDYLPGDKEEVITIRAEMGQFADHMIDEYVALTGIVAALGIKQVK